MTKVWDQREDFYATDRYATPDQERDWNQKMDEAYRATGIRLKEALLEHEGDPIDFLISALTYQQKAALLELLKK